MHSFFERSQCNVLPYRPPPSLISTALHHIPEIGGSVNSGRAGQPEHLSVMGVVVHLYWQAVVRVLWSTQGWVEV